MVVKDIYTEDEKVALMNAIRNSNVEVHSVAMLAREAGLNPNRARFVLEVLLNEGRICRNPVKAYNPRYIRYHYEVV